MSERTKNTTDPRIPEGLAIHAGETTTVQVAMEKTVRVRGRVQTKSDSKPVPGALIYVSYGSFRQSESVVTDANGEYFVNALAGPVRRQLINTPGAFSQWIVEEASWNNRITVPAGKEAFELPPLEMIETIERSGRLVDRQGQPMANVRIFPVAANRRYAGGESGEDGTFKLHLPQELVVKKYELSDLDREIRAEADVVSQSPLVLRLNR